MGAGGRVQWIERENKRAKNVRTILLGDHCFILANFGRKCPIVQFAQTFAKNEFSTDLYYYGENSMNTKIVSKLFLKKSHQIFGKLPTKLGI